MSTVQTPDCIIDFKECGLDDYNSAEVKGDILKDIGKRIIDNFKTYGYCYLKNHGVDETLLDKYMSVSRTFFELPESIKTQYPLCIDYMFGYVKQGAETLNNERSVGDLHEAFNYVPTFDKAWPPVENFETLTKEFYEAGKALTFLLCDALSLGLDLPIDFFRKLHGGALQTRTIYFPIIEDNWKVAFDQARLGEHTDWGTFTLDFQDNSGGLEVQGPDGKFVAADPIPGTCVLTPSALLQRWTSDEIKASVHRVLVPNDERRKKVRQALIFFVNSDSDAQVKCLDGADKYPAIISRDYWASRAKYSQNFD